MIEGQKRVGACKGERLVQLLLLSGTKAQTTMEDLPGG